LTACSRRAIIFSGGPASVLDQGSPRAPQAVFDSGLPILGICYGQQTLATQLGGVRRGRTRGANSAAPMSKS
jgi:GMP synthase (glutamine-hydrolysing)